MSQNNQTQPIKNRTLIYSLLAASSFAFLLIGVAVFYSLAYLPFRERLDLKKCLSDSSSIFEQKQTDVNEKISFLKNQRETTLVEVKKNEEDFLKNNPEPEAELIPFNQSSSLADKYRKKPGDWVSNLNKKSEWLSEKNHIYEPLNEIDRELKNRKNDLDIIKTEKEVQDSKCYKLYN